MTKPCKCEPCINRREWHRKNREKRKPYMREYQRKRYAEKKNRYIPTLYPLSKKERFGHTLKSKYEGMPIASVSL